MFCTFNHAGKVLIGKLVDLNPEDEEQDIEVFFSPEKIVDAIFFHFHSHSNDGLEAENDPNESMFPIGKVPNSKYIVVRANVNLLK